MLTVLWQTKTTVGFPLEDKHLVSKHHVIRSEKVVTPHKKNLLTWYFSRYHVTGLKQSRSFQSVTLKAEKKIGVSRSTGKSNIAQTKNLSDIT